MEIIVFFVTYEAIRNFLIQEISTLHALIEVGVRPRECACAFAFMRKSIMEPQGKLTYEAIPNKS
jgi:hypothetical protein